jgi:hypothetical protein
LHLSGPGLLDGVPAEEGGGEYGDLILKIARAVVERELTVPAIMMLESVKPLSFLGNQMLVFFNPIVTLVISSTEYQRFVRMTEDRENIEKLIVAIEDENALRDSRRREERSRRPGGRGFRLFRRSREPGAEAKGEGIGRQGDYQDPGD